MKLDITARQAEALLELLHQTSENQPMYTDLLNVQKMLEGKISDMNELTLIFAERYGARPRRKKLPEA
ncbi:MAG: hypothetical protein RLZZ156_1414 [Deinococcota bacterium]|jgi:phenylacetate-coenzyme A ligase PaaK-like adenylate-forming protein